MTEKQIDRSPNAGPLFSIVIPAYNRANVIGRTLESLQTQTLGDFEVVVVDDGSSDNLERAIADFGDSRVRYVWQANAGGGAARNRGIDEVRGEYVAFLDSDDTFVPKKLATIAALFPLDEKAVIYSSMRVDRGVGKYWVRPDRGILPGEDVGEYLFVQNQFIQTSTIVLKTSFARAIRFNPTLRKGQDLDLCLRLQEGGAKFRMIDEPLICWTDATEVGRTSHLAGYQPILTWLDQCGSMLTRKAYLGYRATVLAYYMGREQPLTVARDLWLGLFVAGVPLKVILRQALRSYLPKGSYRRLANTVVKLGGVRVE